MSSKRTAIIDAKLQRFVAGLRRSQVHGSRAVAKETAEILRLVVGAHSWEHAQKCLDNVKSYGRRMIEARPSEVAVGNVVRRVLHLIREEYNELVLQHKDEEEDDVEELDGSDGASRPAGGAVPRSPIRFGSSGGATGSAVAGGSSTNSSTNIETSPSTADARQALTRTTVNDMQAQANPLRSSSPSTWLVQQSERQGVAGAQGLVRPQSPQSPAGRDSLRLSGAYGPLAMSGGSSGQDSDRERTASPLGMSEGAGVAGGGAGGASKGVTFAADVGSGESMSSSGSGRLPPAGLMRQSSMRLGLSASTDQAPSLLHFVTQDDDSTNYSEYKDDLRRTIADRIEEIIEDLSRTNGQIAQHALSHVHANEIIMTFGLSSTVEEFLLQAGRKRKFEVIVAEAAPNYVGHQTANRLSKQSKGNITVTLIHDAAIFAMMSRVNKVIVGTHAVMANGGLLAHNGMHVLATAAKFHAVPIVVCTGLYKLCPLFMHDADMFSELDSPANVLPFDVASRFSSAMNVVNPRFDYIPPELVHLFITELGPHSPSYIYRMLADRYSQEDADL